MRSCSRCHTPYTTLTEFCGLDGAPVIESDVDLLIGKDFDRYRVVGRLGGGGMAAVYRAVHQVIDREVAIKILYGELASDRAFAERFRREALAASRIKHPNVVEVLDFGATAEGMSFLIMEHLAGHTLSEEIDRVGAFPARRAGAILRQVAAGLAAAHRLGFVHRDLKPGNIMTVDATAPEGGWTELSKILDFGLVQARVDGDEDERLTNTGETLGTPVYMAPEQFAGAQASALSDLYSLGAVLHEMLAGKAPFGGSLGQVMLLHASASPPPLPSSSGLEELSRRLLEKDPKKRPQSADEVIAAIDELALGPVRREDVPARAPTLELKLEDVVIGSTTDLPLVEADTVRKSAVTVASPKKARAPSRTSRWGAVVPLGAMALAAGMWFDVIPYPTAIDGLLAMGAATALPTTTDGEPSAASITSEVQSALQRRGLTLDDATSMESLSPAILRLQEALAAGDGEAARTTVDELLPAIARARVDQELLLAKLQRLGVRLADGSSSLPKEERATLAAQAAAIRAQISLQLSEAECSRLALRIAELERAAVTAGP